MKPPGSSPGTSRRRTRLPVGSIVAVVGLVMVGLTIGHAQRAARSGEELYIDRFGCWNCHGQTGAGGAGPSILKSQLSLRKFVTSVRLPVQTMPDPGAEETGGVESVAADVHGAVLAATIRGGALAVKKYVKAR